MTRSRRQADRFPAGRIVDRSGSGLGASVAVFVPGLIGFAAAAYGGVEAWTHTVMLGLAAVLVGLAAAGVWRRGLTQQQAFPLAIVAAFAALAVAQAIEAPRQLVDAVSPARVDAAERAPGIGDVGLAIAYYPLATWRGLRVYLIASAVFAATLLTIRRGEHVRLLLGGLFLVGVAESALAIAQLVTGAEGIYWSSRVADGSWTGTFINHSNFAQLLNLTGGAGVGLLLVRLSDDRHRRRGRSDVGQFLWRHGWLLSGLAVHAIAIAVSLSRGGVIGMVLASTVVALLMGRRRGLGWQGWTFLTVPVLVFGGLVLVGFDTVYERLGTLREAEAYTDRWQLTLDTLGVARDHLLTGVGLDNHGYVFPSYDTTETVAAAEQADNDYAQLIEEMGLLGVALVAALLGRLAWRLRWPMLTEREGSLRYAAYGVVFGLVGVAWQSLTDFGLRLPAVGGASAALAAIGFVVAQTESESRRDRALGWGGRLGVAAVGAAALGLCCWTMVGAFRDARAESWAAIARDREQSIRRATGPVDLQERIDLVAAAEQAASLRPRDVEYAFWLNAYRWELLVDAAGGVAPVIASADGREYTRQITDALTETRRLCPVFGPAATLEGRLRAALGDPGAGDLIDLGATLAPKDPAALITAAEAALRSEDDPARGLALLSKAVELDASLFGEAAVLALRQADAIDWVRDLADGHLGRLDVLLRLLRSIEGAEEVATDVAGAAAALREQRVVRGEASAGQTADFARMRAAEGDHEVAVRLYRDALAEQYENVSWRIGLADSLTALDRLEEAYRELRIGLRIRPNDPGVRRRLEELTVRLPTDESETAP